MMQFTDNILEAPDKELVCYCSGVTKKVILGAKEQGATSLAAIREATGACTLAQCAVKSPRHRCCAREIRALIGEKDVFGSIENVE